MKRLKNSLLFQVLVALVLLGVVFVMGAYVGYGNRPAVERVISLSGKEIGKPVSVDFTPFWEAWSILEDKYSSPSVATTSTSTVVAVTDEDKVWGAIEGLAKSLGDPYTVFFPPEENQMFHDDLAGEFSGVGMEIGIRRGVLTVVAPLEGTPAQRAGIRAGDQVIAVDDESTIDLTVEQAVRLIRGPKGEAVVLKILREGDDSAKDISVVRDTIEVPTMRTESRDGNGNEITKESGLQQGEVFVIKLFNFGAQSPRLFRASLQDFANSGADKLILDLRSNPGGFLEAAVDLSSWFLPSGKVVVTERVGKEGTERIHRSKGYDVFEDDLKMAILVDRGSASASEIMAGALQEHGVAILVGEQTYGKGSVQELVNVTKNTSLKVTIARWFTPLGNSISEHGLKPDFAVEVTDADREKGLDPVLKKAIEILDQQP